MPSSVINKCLWAFTYVATAGASVYTTAYVMGADPKSILISWQTQSEKTIAMPSFKSVASSSPKIRSQNETEVQTPGFEIGPFDAAAAQKKECNLSPKEISDAKDRQANRLEEFRQQGDDPMQDYDYLWNRYQSVGECADNLRILGLDKKQFFERLRLAVVAKMQKDYRDMATTKYPQSLVEHILDDAEYAGISDDGVKNVSAGLAAARLPSEAQLRGMAENRIRDNLGNDVNTMRSFTGGGGGPSRIDARLAAMHVREALRDTPNLVVSMGVSADEIQKVETRIDADMERENREYELTRLNPRF